MYLKKPDDNFSWSIINWFVDVSQGSSWWEDYQVAEYQRGSSIYFVKLEQVAVLPCLLYHSLAKGSKYGSEVVLQPLDYQKSEPALFVKDAKHDRRELVLDKWGPLWYRKVSWSAKLNLVFISFPLLLISFVAFKLAKLHLVWQVTVCSYVRKGRTVTLELIILCFFFKSSFANLIATFEWHLLWQTPK